MLNKFILKRTINRRNFIKKGSFGLLTLGSVPVLSCTKESDSSTSESSSSNSNYSSSFSVPPLIEPQTINGVANSIHLEAKDTTTQFYSGFDSPTKCYQSVDDLGNNSSNTYLGPTIRIQATNSNSSASGTQMVDKGSKLSSGTSVKFKVKNSCTIAAPNSGGHTGNTNISSHWHGLHCDGYTDGNGFNTVASGNEWVMTMPIYQQAGTNWYHTHIHHQTGVDSYKGLAGLFIIDDTNSKALDNNGLPSTYGSDDIPLIIQDKVFTNNVMDFSDLGGRFLGDTFLVNGSINPNLEVEKGIYRFRLLNASNARFYNFYIENSSGLKNTYQHIATDGGFIGNPVSTTDLRMGSGERNEILVDFSAYSVGEVLTLKSTGSNNNGSQDTSSTITIMSFTVSSEQTSLTENNSIPPLLNGSFSNDRSTLLAKTPNASVRIELKGGANPIASARAVGSSIPSASNFTFEMETGNFTSKSTRTTSGWTEQWSIRGNLHPFHLHGCHFLIKSIGGDTNIPPNLQGWKDVVEVEGGQDVVLYVQFDEYALKGSTSVPSGDSGLYTRTNKNGSTNTNNSYMYMMHCHIFGHEDNGMMGVFEVT